MADLFTDRSSLIGSLMTHLDEAKADLYQIMKKAKSWPPQAPVHKNLKVLHRDMAMLSAHAMQVMQSVCQMEARHRTFQQRTSDFRPELTGNGKSKTSAEVPEPQEMEPEVHEQVVAKVETPKVEPPKVEATAPPPEPPRQQSAEDKFMTSVSKTAQGLPPELLRKLRREQEKG